MKFTLRQRAARVKRERALAEEQLRRVEDQWPTVEKAVEPIRRHRELNGWTDTIVTIFGTPKQTKESRG